MEYRIQGLYCQTCRQLTQHSVNVSWWTDGSTWGREKWQTMCITCQALRPVVGEFQAAVQRARHVEYLTARMEGMRVNG